MFGFAYIRSNTSARLQYLCANRMFCIWYSANKVFYHLYNPDSEINTFCLYNIVLLHGAQPNCELSIVNCELNYFFFCP